MSCAGASSPAFQELFNHVIDGNQLGINKVEPVCKAAQEMGPIKLTNAEQVGFPAAVGDMQRGDGLVIGSA
jgi:hypothetical protein